MTIGLNKWDLSRYLLVEDGHDTHHLGPANRFGETSLVTPCELGFRATFNLAHVGDEVRQEPRICGFIKRVDTQLVEPVVSA